MDDHVEPQLCACGCGRPLPKPRYLHGHRQRRLSFKVEDRGYETPCWIAQGFTHPDGYVRRRRSVNGVATTVMAHRESYEQQIGPVPDGMQLDHLCRVRSCIRPSHLDPVPASTNTRRGALTKLTESDVRFIRRLRRGEIPHVELAERFDVTVDLIRHVRARQKDGSRGLWKGVE